MRLMGTLATVIILAAAASLCSGADEHLVGHWRLDGDLDPVVWDDGPYGLHGTAYNIAYGRGAIGLAAVFDSTRDEILIRDEAGLAPLRIGELTYGTICVWFRYQSIGGQILPILYFGEADADEPHNSLIIEIGHGNPRYNGGTPPHRQTTPETSGGFAESPFLRPDLLGHSERGILHVGAARVKWRRPSWKIENSLKDLGPLGQREE